MFDSLSDRLSDVFDRLRRHGALTEADVGTALREIRIALLEADVALPVVRDFVAAVREKALGQEVLRSVTPAQMVVKIVHDHLVEMLGGGPGGGVGAARTNGIDLNAPSPVAVMLVGLQGSGKTTTAAKIASRLKGQNRKKVLLASLDVQRPAAQEQLAILGRQIGVVSLPIVPGERPVAIARRALQTGRTEGYDVVILDTAGRLHVNEELMLEVAAVREVAMPHETLLVADAMTGQDAATTAKAFADALPLTGVILTKTDGDARGGAALSVRYITGRPIKFIGVSEKPDGLDAFHPDRIAQRILGMGDVLSLVEQVEQNVDKEKAQKLAEKVIKGKRFDMNDMRDQLQQMMSMGGVASMMDKLPGLGSISENMKSQVNDKQVSRMVAIINSMTKKERRHPDLLNGSRKARVARGSGTQPADVNRLLKQYMQMERMMSKLSSGGMKGLMRQMGAAMKGMGGGGLPPGGMPGR